MKKKLVSLFLIVALTSTLISIISIKPVVQAAPTINVGDYILLGNYNDEPILWRCVNIDENGPLMLSDRILSIKPFDTAGNHTYSDGTSQADSTGQLSDFRKIYGSNLWETSNMRCWLNSTASAGNVTWLDGCPPTEEKVSLKVNDYAQEKGFLAEGNFTASELNVIKSVTQKSLLNDLDVAKLKEGGTESNVGSKDISTLVQNFDTSYFQNVTDKMFLLDIKQIYNVYQNRATLGSNYYMGMPTQKAVDTSGLKDRGLKADKYWFSWLRSPNAGPLDPDDVRCVSYDRLVYYSSADMNYGVRPAFYLDQKSEIFKFGSGTVKSPYVATRENALVSALVRFMNLINHMAPLILTASAFLLLTSIIIIIILMRKRKKALKPSVLYYNTNPDMWLCICGRSNASSSTFCRSCGAKKQ